MFRSMVWMGATILAFELVSPATALDETFAVRKGRSPLPAATTGDKPPQPVPKRSWGPEQATGAPDAPNAGDSASAWASLSQDDQAEWLVCEYARPTNVVAIHVHENYCPGALVKVTAFGVDGKEVVAWEGADPTPRDKEHGVSTLKVGLGFDVQRIKLYLDSAAVTGWNEIDAVGLEDDKGEKHWATKVEASTTYATTLERGGFRMVEPEPVDLQPALKQLQDDVAELKATQKELRKEIRELKDLLKAVLKDR
jgi:hypothetical protein